MAYNPFPVGYQPMIPQYQPPQQASQGLIWVDGEGAARSYLVAPNSTVQLWDSSAQVVYLKSADASGMPSMKILDYTIRDAPKTRSEAASAPVDNYVTKAEIDAIKAEIEAIRTRLNAKEDHDNG